MAYLDEKTNLYVFDTVYYECIRTLDGHTSLIKDVHISEDDLHMVSTCMSGYVI